MRHMPLSGIGGTEHDDRPLFQPLTGQGLGDDGFELDRRNDRPAVRLLALLKYAVLEGACGDGSRSARRKPGWEVLPRGEFPFEGDSDGQLEILVQTFDHGLDIFTIPGSGCNCLLWTTARRGALRMGQPSAIN